MRSQWTPPVRVDARDLRIGDRVWLEVDATTRGMEKPEGPGTLITRISRGPYGAWTSLWVEGDDFATQFDVRLFTYEAPYAGGAVTEEWWGGPVWARLQVDQAVDLSPHEVADAALTMFRSAMADMLVGDETLPEIPDALAHLYGAASFYVAQHRRRHTAPEEN